MEEPKEDIINKACERARHYQSNYTGCAQCVIAGIFEALGIENNDLIKAATGLSGGLGLSGEGHCGAISGASIAISHIFGRRMEDLSDIARQSRALSMSRKLYRQFVAKYGTARCADVRHEFVSKDAGSVQDKLENGAAVDAGLLDACGPLVGKVAGMTVRIILDAIEKEKQAPVLPSTPTLL